MTNRHSQDSVELTISQTLLGTLGIARKYHLPTVSPPEMNKELDKLYKKKVKDIQKLLQAERRKAVEEIYEDISNAGRANTPLQDALDTVDIENPLNDTINKHMVLEYLKAKLGDRNGKL